MFGRKSILALFSFLLGRLFNGLIYIYAVNKFLPFQFGFFQIATSIMVIFSLIASLGFDDAHLIIFADSKKQNNAFTIYFMIKFILLFISAVTTFLIVFIQINQGKVSNTREQLNILFLVFTNTLLLSVNSIYRLSFKGKLNIAKSELPFLIGVFIGSVFSFLSILIFHNFLLYILGSTVANLANLILYFYYGRNFKLKKIDTQILKRYISLGLLFLFPVILYNLRIGLGPILFLKYFDETLLGAYSVLSYFFLMIKAIELSFGKLLFPKLKKLISGEKLSEAKNIVEIFCRYISILNGVLIITGIIFAEPIVKYVFGNYYYEKGMYFFYGYLLSLLPFSFMIAYNSLIVSAEKMKMYYLTETISFIFSLISWFVLIPLLNIVGIEIGSWIALIPNIIIMRIYSSKQFNIGNLYKKEILHFIVLFILFSISLFLSFKHVSSWILVVSYILVVAIYSLFLYLFKILRKSDIKYIFEVINIKKMVNYVRTETKENV